MRSFIAPVLALAGSVLAQGTEPPQDPVKHAEQAAPPPFPKDKAKWVIRGTTRADAMIQQADRVWGPKVRVRRVPDERRRCNAGNFTLPHVFVYLRGVEKRWTFPEPRRPKNLTLTPLRLLPPVLGIQAGTRLCLRNQLDRAPGIAFKCWNTGKGFMRQIEDTQRFEFHLPGGPATWQIQCLPHRSALVHIVAHPVHTVTDPQGGFRLPPVPPGEYQLVALHELLGTVTTKVTVGDKHPTPVLCVFEVPSILRAKRVKKSLAGAAEYRPHDYEGH